MHMAGKPCSKVMEQLRWLLRMALDCLMRRGACRPRKVERLALTRRPLWCSLLCAPWGSGRAPAASCPGCPAARGMWLDHPLSAVGCREQQSIGSECRAELICVRQQHLLTAGSDELSNCPHVLKAAELCSSSPSLSTCIRSSSAGVRVLHAY